ncbi:hypothetical protein BZA77DRAFT_308070 [Pyronema omphalodes]|nr:hypothetical protein BZA77DRAFT_324189 [Pyronema omphalodes]KAI5817981.1 hypothetical protein BZA77DRAFT_308070 [Pyronema omphalodes]
MELELSAGISRVESAKPFDWCGAVRLCLAVVVMRRHRREPLPFWGASGPSGSGLACLVHARRISRELSTLDQLRPLDPASTSSCPSPNSSAVCYLLNTKLHPIASSIPTTNIEQSTPSPTKIMVTKRKSTPSTDAATPKRPRTTSHDGSEAPKQSLNARRNVKTNVKVYRPGEACTYVPKVITAKDMATTEYRSVQRNTCQRWPTSVVNDQCMSCIEKQAACGTCRFLNLRVFRETVDEKGIVAVDYDDYAFRGNQDDPVEPAKPPRSTKRENKKFRTRIATKAYSMDLDVPEGEAQEELTKSGNTYPTPERALPLQTRRENAEYVIPIIAPSFIEHLARELHHENTHLHRDVSSTLPGGPRPMIRIKNTPQTKTICDVCSTSVYMGSYMCGCCGRELCLGCWEEFLPSAQMYSGRVSRIDQCSRKRRHTRDSILFVTRAHPGEIDTLLRKVEGLSKDLQALSTNVDEVVDKIPTKVARSPSSNGPSYLPVPSAHYKDIDLQTFQCLWRKGGVPLVLTNMLERFQLPWSPQYFIDEHGPEYCLIHDCSDDTFHETHVSAFFARFGGKHDKSYKLKDWPPSSEFKVAFPKLWDDFENALPFPEYTRRSGPFNLASHIPPDWNAPDLGPKMYNAYPAVDFLPRDISSMTPGQKTEFQKNVIGTTNLHLDLTDAVNIMLFASGGQDAPEISTTDKGIPECGAVWDIFPPSSVSAIRAYLKETREEVDDPIHRQCFYLSEHDLEVLSQRGVGSYRIFQDPGDAVFIPAGCPHQVRNRRSCVKVAVDFLSPENVHLCTRLIEEARSMAPRIPKPGMKLMGKKMFCNFGIVWDLHPTPIPTPTANQVAIATAPAPASHLSQKKSRTKTQQQRPKNSNPRNQTNRNHNHNYNQSP